MMASSETKNEADDLEIGYTRHISHTLAQTRTVLSFGDE